MAKYNKPQVDPELNQNTGNEDLEKVNSRSSESMNIEPEIKDATPDIKTEEKKETIQPVDKYAESVKRDPNESYDIVNDILKSNLTLDEKLDAISEKAHISYKAVVEQFRDYNKVYVEEQLIADSMKFAKATSSLFKTLVKILDQDDHYVCFLQLQIVLMLFTKYQSTSLHAVAYSIYDDSFFGSEAEYQEFQFVMATLGVMATIKDKNKIFKQINFNKPEFKYGKKLEEFYRTIFL